MNHRTAVVCCALVAWAFNPAYLMGCGAESTFTFGEEEMLSLMHTLEEGIWEVEREGQIYTLEFELRQSEVLEITRRQTPGFVGAALACGNRSFVSAANACIDTSHLGIQGTVDVTNKASGELVQSGLIVTGSMEVIGLNLSNATVRLEHSGGLFSFTSAEGTHFTIDDVTW